MGGSGLLQRFGRAWLFWLGIQCQHGGDHPILVRHKVQVLHVRHRGHLSISQGFNLGPFGLDFRGWSLNALIWNGSSNSNLFQFVLPSHENRWAQHVCEFLLAQAHHTIDKRG